MTFKDLRLKIFNWLAAGKMTLTTDKSQEYTPLSQSTYTLLGGTGGGGYGLNSSGGYSGISINPYGNPIMNLPINLTIKIATANGGTVVSINNSNDHSKEELYIISDSADFDRELGKIITMNRLKA